MPNEPRRHFLNVYPDQSVAVVRGLGSPVRIRILKLLQQRGPMNVNEIAEALGLPQSTIATNVQVLEDCELIKTQLVKATRGQQKICSARYGEIVIRLDAEPPERRDDIIDVAMPLGLYTSCSVSAPCGLCSVDGIIGVLDVPDLFLDPRRMQAALLWFGRGYVEYKFPNNAKILNSQIEAIQFSMELSSEVPGTNENWPSDITLWVNNVRIGVILGAQVWDTLLYRDPALRAEIEALRQVRPRRRARHELIELRKEPPQGITFQADEEPRVRAELPAAEQTTVGELVGEFLASFGERRCLPLR